MFLFLALPAIVFGTDCNVVRQVLYGTEPCEYEMKCSTGFACLVTEESCDHYECLTEEMGCPDGYTFSPFIEPNSAEGTGQSTTTSSGFYCQPPGPSPPETFTCFFDPEDNFKLKVNVAVPEINKFQSWDDREITLISKDVYNTQDQSGVPWTVFGGSSCVGTTVDGNVYFNNIVEDENCDFTLSKETDEAGTLWYTQSFSVGYDDLTDVTYPILVFRYGRNWNMECRIKASDTLYVEPGAEGDREEDDTIIETEVEFAMGVYYDAEFTRPFTTSIDIGVESMEDQTVYIKGEAFMQNAGDYMLHMKECKVNHFLNGEIVQESTMMSDGCLRGYDQDFIDRHFEQKSNRVEFADSSEKTVNNDQFSVELWQVALPGQTVTYRFTCHMVICSINSFAGTQDSQSVCFLDSYCPSRYNNLFTSVRGVKTEIEVSRSEVYEVEYDLTVNAVEGDAQATPPPVGVIEPTPAGGSAATITGGLAMMLMMLI